MTIKEFLELSNITRKISEGAIVEDYVYQETRPRIECRDGFSMSIQAGYGLYCIPRVSGSPAYYNVEIGYPSDREELIIEYAENKEAPTDTVYGYVPINLVEKVIKKHGGMEDEKMIDILTGWAQKRNHDEMNFKELLYDIRSR